MKHFQSKVLTAAILAALSGSAMADNPSPSTDEIAKAALVNSYNNTQDINGFKVGDTIYDIENGQPKGRSATEDDVKADDFGGLGLKEVVAQHDQSLADLTETVNETAKHW
ncbi:TPA: hypothetical protein ACJMB8_000922 [Neisseria meningitidis]